VTDDGGVTWTLTKALSGFRSVVAYVPQQSSLIAVGPSGADYSPDDGRSWQPIDADDIAGFHTFAFPRHASAAAPGWAAGEHGQIARIDGLTKNAVTKSGLTKKTRD